MWLAVCLGDSTLLIDGPDNAHATGCCCNKHYGVPDCHQQLQDHLLLQVPEYVTGVCP